jgi:hypothetical protein
MAPLTGSTPGETKDLRVTSYDRQTGQISISYTPACASRGNTIVFGPLSAVRTYGYSGQVCNIGNSGQYTSFNPGPGSFFFLVVADDGGAAEGSYGTNSDHQERPEQMNDPACSLAQDLSRRCD